MKVLSANHPIAYMGEALRVEEVGTGVGYGGGVWNQSLLFLSPFGLDL